MASSPRSQPFSEPEQRFLVAEVIKNSSISLNKLISIVVADEMGQPNWDEMLVPYGRTMAECKEALRSLRSMASSTTFGGPVSQLPPAAATSNKRKSDQSFDQPVEQVQRRPSAGPHQNLYNIQPRPSPTYSPRSQATFAQPPAAPPAKKRGRPSKAESERKHREAIERGEVIASISPRGGPGTSEGSSYQAIAPAPPELSQAGAAEPQPLRLASAESPDRRKRPKTAKPVKQEHMTGQGFFHSNPPSTMGPGEQRGFSATVFESTPASPAISSAGVLAPQSPYSAPPPTSNTIPPIVSAPSTGPLPPIQPEPKT